MNSSESSTFENLLKLQQIRDLKLKIQQVSMLTNLLMNCRSLNSDSSFEHIIEIKKDKLQE